MWKILRNALLPLALFGSDIEIALPTQSPVKPLYISRLKTDPSEWDWPYYEELRKVLEFDLGSGGYSTVLSLRDELEDLIQWPEVRRLFKLDTWKKEKIPFVVAIEVDKKRFCAIVFNVDKETSKKYPDIPLTGRLETDRRAIHKLSDAIHKDLFGVEGIASLRILYTERIKSSDDARGLSWTSEICVCDSDGGNARQLTSEKGYCMTPGFFPKKGEDPEFFYVFNNEGQTKIYRASLAKPQGQLLVSLRGNQALPCIDKSGTQLAFITDVAGRPDLFVQNLDAKGRPVGRSRQLYSSPRATQASPSYSPDGKRVVFVSDKDGPPRIYELEVPQKSDTHKLRPKLLTLKNRENTSPTWSPDGKKLAYSAKIDGVRQIWIYNFETESEVQLTTGPETKENPSWAPDSLHIVYNTESQESSELYLINLNQPEPLLLSGGPGQKRFPCWEPK
jgi:TolB protein